MSTQTSRRGRGGRGTTLRLSCEASSDWRTLFVDQTVLLRVGLAAVAIGLLLIAVQAWRHAFPHRLGERPADGVAAVVKFSRVSRDRTARARDRAADQVPLVFRLDKNNQSRIPTELRNSLVPLQAAPDLESVPIETRRAFGLTDSTVGGAGAPVGADRIAAYERLKAVSSNETQLTEVIEEFTRFLQRIEKTGLIRPEHLPRDVGGSGLATVVSADGEETVPLTEIQLQPVLATGGRLEPKRWNVFPALAPLQTELDAWLRARSPETLLYDDAATQKLRAAARRETPPEYDLFNVGQQLVSAGESIDDAKLELLQAEYEQLESQISFSERVLRVIVVCAMLAVLAILIGYHLVHHEPKLVWNLPRYVRYLALIVAGVWLGRSLSFDPWRAEIGAVLAVVMICSVVHNQVLATLTAFALSTVVTTACGGDLGRFTVMMSVCATAVILLPSVPTRSTLVTVGGWTALVCFLMSWGTTLINSPGGTVLWNDAGQWSQSLRSAGWCLAAGFLVSGSLPFIESWFGAVTDISLLELGDVSHPLLQELVRRAPGTYNHSITVASIGETAADAIGANGLLVRVGAYFHDIGKMLKPHYFVENNSGGENRHEHLAPAMSTLIIIGHVKDGVDLGREHNLPEPLLDFIEQHHGTTLVEYFYHEATRQAEEQPDHRHEVQESLFRYPGPKPQTRESAVLMIADAVEGASRTLSEPTAKRIERLVHEIVMKRLLDGQFDECGLTLTDLNRIEDSLTKSLTAMYHGRVKYPEQRTA